MNTQLGATKAVNPVEAIQPQGEIGDELNFLDENIGILSDLVNELNGRVELVSSAAEPEGVVDSDAKNSRESHMACHLQGYNGRISCNISKLRTMINRLRL